MGSRTRTAMGGGAMALALAWAVLLGAPTIERTARGSTQQCNTVCQEKMTDCIEGCDDVLSCELECKRAAVGCVMVCSSDAARPVAPAAPFERADAGIEDGHSPEASRAPSRDAARDAARSDGGRPVSARDR